MVQMKGVYGRSLRQIKQIYRGLGATSTRVEYSSMLKEGGNLMWHKARLLIEKIKSKKFGDAEEIDVRALGVIDREIRAYFSSKTSYRALVFSAPWGSGKTTLIKKWMKDNTSMSRRQQRKNIKFEPITYVSAFGVKSGAELIAKIHAEIVLSQGSSYRMANSVAKNVYQLVGLSPDVAAQVLLKVAVKPKHLIIDDLERINFEGLNSIFGAINAISEQMGIKTVIVCDIERFLPEKHGEHAEKLIKEVINLEIDKSYATRNIFRKECADLPGWISNTDMFEDAVSDSRTDNVRHIEKAAQTYKRFADIVSTLPLVNVGSFGLLTYGLIAYCIENQITPLTDEDLNEVNRYLARKDQAGRVSEFRKKYSKIDISQDHHAPLSAKLIRNVVLRNCSNIEEIREEISSSHHFRNQEQEEWELVWKLTTSPRDKLDAAIVEQREKITSRSYLNTGVILHVFANELRLSEIQFAARSYDSIVEEAKRYIDDVKVHPSLYVHYEKDGALYESISMSAYNEKGYPDHGDEIYPYFKEIRDYMKDEIRGYHYGKALKYLKELFRDVSGNLEKIDEFLMDRNSSFYRGEIIHNLDYKDVASQISMMDAPSRYSINLLLSSRVYNREHDRANEIKWIKLVGKELFEIAQSRDAIDKNSMVGQAEYFLKYKKDELIDSTKDSGTA